MSPKKKARVANGSSVVTPAIEHVGRMEARSSSEGAFDASMDFSDIDMNGFMDVDDIDIKPSAPAKKERPTAKVDSEPIHNAAKTLKKEDLATPSWLSVYDFLAVVSKGTLGSRHPSTRSRTMAVCACSGWTISGAAVNSA